MGTQEKMEREINLQELFWNILLGWRSIICFGLIFALLLGGVKYAKDMRSYRAAQNVKLEQKEQELTEEEKQQIADAGELMAQINEYEKYMNTSKLMEIDPYEKNIVTLRYRIKSDYTFNYTKDNQKDYTDDVVTAYANYAGGGEMTRKIIEGAKLDIDQEDLCELESVWENDTFVNIEFTYPEKEKLEDVSKVIKAQMGQKEEEFQSIGSHTLILQSEYQNVVVDSNLAERRNTIATNVANIKTQLDNMKTNMSEQQLKLLEKEESKDTKKKEEKPAAVKPGFSLKYAVLGGIFGVFLICIWIVCKMLFTARLQNSEEIRSLYGVRMLGEVAVESEKDRFLSVIDKKLLAVKNRRKKKLSQEQQIKLVSANIALSCRQQGVDCIYITGSEYEKIDAKAADMLRQELSAQNLQIKEGENIFYDAKSLQEGMEVGNLLFVEQTNCSIYDEISNELNLAKEQNGNILGIVVFV